MAPPWVSGDKTVVPNAATASVPGYVAPAVALPAPPRSVSFDLKALALSVGTLQALTTANQALIQARIDGMTLLLAAVLDDGPGDLVPTADLGDIADYARSALAGDLGAGVTDLVMQAMGYAWRTHGAVMGLPGRVGDFIYDGGAVGLSAREVVMAEAKGSFANHTNLSQVRTTAVNALLGQVAPHLGRVLSSGDRIVHGYGVCHGAPLASPPSSTVVAEPFVPVSGTPPTAPVAGAGITQKNGHAVLGTYLAAFRLMGADAEADYITAVLAGKSGREPPVLESVYSPSDGVVLRPERLRGERSPSERALGGWLGLDRRQWQPVREALAAETWPDGIEVDPAEPVMSAKKGYVRGRDGLTLTLEG